MTRPPRRLIIKRNLNVLRWHSRFAPFNPADGVVVAHAIRTLPLVQRFARRIHGEAMPLVITQIERIFILEVPVDVGVAFEIGGVVAGDVGYLKGVEPFGYRSGRGGEKGWEEREEVNGSHCLE